SKIQDRGSRILVWRFLPQSSICGLRSSIQRNPGISGAVEDNPLMLRRQLFKGRVEGQAGVASQGFGEAKEFRILVQDRPGGQGALPQRQLRIADEQCRIGAALDAESLTCWTPAERTVEGEMVGVQRLEAAAAAVTSKMLAVALDFPFSLVPVFVNEDDV